MVEAPDEKTATKYAKDISKLIKSKHNFKVIIANFKSNGSSKMLKTWIEDFKKTVITIDSNIGISPPYVYLDQLKNILFSSDIDSIQIGSQDVDHSDGARTGAISTNALDLGINLQLLVILKDDLYLMRIIR